MAQVTLNKKSASRLITKLKLLANPTRKKDADALGKVIVKEMKKDISRTTSPITGKKFLALKKKYKARKQAAGKGGSPNLKFSGKFLKSLISFSNKIKGGHSTTIGFSSALSKQKELGHRDGANTQKKRPIIPNASEGFNKRISAIIKSFYLNRIRDIVRR